MRRRLLAIPLLGLLVATAALTRRDGPSPPPPPIDRPLGAVSATAKAVRVSTNPARFTTLPPGSSLPTDAQCTAAVRRGGGEVRAGNATPNATRGRQKNLTLPDFSRVDGQFTGTTDEILRWAACKWGIDEDIVNAQAAIESWWRQNTMGDWTTDAAALPRGPWAGRRRPGGQVPAEPRHPAEPVSVHEDAFPGARGRRR